MNQGKSFFEEMEEHTKVSADGGLFLGAPEIILKCCQRARRISNKDVACRCSRHQGYYYSRRRNCRHKILR